MHRTCNESRKRKLRELYKYTVYLDVPDKWATNNQVDQLEDRFLDENDIEKYVLNSLLAFILNIATGINFLCCHCRSIPLTLLTLQRSLL